MSVLQLALFYTESRLVIVGKYWYRVDSWFGWDDVMFSQTYVKLGEVQ